MRPNTILAPQTAWVLKPVWLSVSWLVIFRCWELVPCLQRAVPASGWPSQLKNRDCAVSQSLRRAGWHCWGAEGKSPVVPTCPHCGVAGGCRKPDSSPATGWLQDVQTPPSSASRCAKVRGATSAWAWGWASCLTSPPGSPAGWSHCCHCSSAVGTQGSLIKLGCVATSCNHSLNDCEFGLVDLLNPCIFSVPVRCKSQTFSIFFIWFQKTVSVLKTSLWKMLVYPAVLFYLGWLHN